MRKRKIRTGNFADQANSDEGRKRRDAEVTMSLKGEDTETTMGVSSSGKPTQTITVLK